MKKFTVQIMHEAEQDLLELYYYVANNDSIIKADNLLTKIEELCYSLEHLPERGHVPPELQRIAITAYRELHFKSYRIIYKIIDKQVYVYAVLDGRRNLEYFLVQRLLNSSY